MLTTREINSRELIEKFEWLATEYKDSLEGGPSVAFPEELVQPYKPAPDVKYFMTVAHDLSGKADAPLLLIRSAQTGDRFRISFARLFNREECVKLEAHLWLENALEEIIIPWALSRNVNLITATGITKRGEKTLQALEQLKINGVSRFELTPTELGLQASLNIALPDCLHRFKGAKAFDEFKPGDCLRPPNLLKNIKWNRPTHTCALIEGEHCPFPGGPFVLG